MEKRHLDDLWTAYRKIGKSVITDDYGLDWRVHLRYQNGKYPCVVLVIRRSKPNEGFAIGNFAVDERNVRFIIRSQDQGKISTAYIALVEDFNGKIITWDTAKNILRGLQDVDPYTNPETEHYYYWVDERFQPISGGRRDLVPEITEAPF